MSMAALPLPSCGLLSRRYDAGAVIVQAEPVVFDQVVVGVDEDMRAEILKAQPANDMIVIARPTSPTIEAVFLAGARPDQEDLRPAGAPAGLRAPSMMMLPFKRRSTEASAVDNK